MAQATPPVPPVEDPVPPVPTPPAAAAQAAPSVPGADAAPATVPPAAAPTAPAPVPVPGKRRIWPFILGGAVVLLILIVVGVTVLVGSILGTVGSASGPGATVIAFDKAYADVNCAEFQSATTPAFQGTYFAKGFSCDQWNPIATGLHDNGKYDYTVVINDTKVSGATADVTTTERDTTPGSEQDYALIYHLVKSGNAWLIDGIGNVG